jgi:FMN-dependent NADH-azoreductase
MRLLNIASSPRDAKSVSIAVANAFLDAYCAASPSTEVDTLNVWEENLPDFDSQAIGAKYKGVSKEPMDSSELSIWLRIQSLVRRFQQADRIVLGVPMWNFAYPYKLKQLIDLVSQRNMLFTFDGKTYGPMLKIPRALVIYVRGQSHDRGAGISSPGSKHQADYIDFWLKFRLY